MKGRLADRYRARANGNNIHCSVGMLKTTWNASIGPREITAWQRVWTRDRVSVRK